MNNSLGGSGSGGDRDPYRRRSSHKSTHCDHGSDNNQITRVASTPSLSACEATVASSVTEHNALSNDDDNDLSNDNGSTPTTPTTAVAAHRRRRLHNQAFHLSIASTASVAILIVYTVPAQLLIGIGIVVSLFTALLYTLFQRVVFEYSLLVNGRGIGDALPPSLFDQLANMSLHDWLIGTGAPGMLEQYGYLMLYFVPGLTTEQIGAYVNRLNPRHQDVLRRRGLGHIFGTGFMRLLLGDERLHAVQDTIQDGDTVPTIHQQPQPPRRISAATASARIVPRRLNLHNRDAAAADDDTSELGIEGTESQPTAVEAVGRTVTFHTAEAAAAAATTSTQRNILGSSSSQHAVASPARNRPNANNEQPSNRSMSDLSSDDDDENEVDEFNILVEAVSAGLTSMTSIAIGSAVATVQDYTSRAFNFLAGSTLRASLTVTFLSTGIGLFGMWAGVYDMNRMSGDPNAPRAPLRIPASFQAYFPSARSVWNVSMASSAASSFFFMFGHIPHRSNSSSDSNRGSDQNDKPRKDD